MGTETLIHDCCYGGPKKIISRLLIVGSLIGLSLPALALDVVLAFTHVQAPSTSLDGTARTQMIINHLRRLEAGPVAVFVRTRELTPKTRARISLYDNAGHLLINSGHRYHLLSRPDLYRYQADLLIADAHLRAYKNYVGHVHFANFETAQAISHRERLLNFAAARALIPSAVSIQVHDAYLNRRYQQQVNRNRRVDMAALQDAYVDMIWQQLLYYQRLAMPTYGRAPIVLQLEAHDLTAYFLPGLIDRIRENGGRILPPQTVFSRPLINSVAINLHTPQGYGAALGLAAQPRLQVPHSVGGDQLWADQFLLHHSLLQ
jgi:hypothetical protein